MSEKEPRPLAVLRVGRLQLVLRPSTKKVGIEAKLSRVYLNDHEMKMHDAEDSTYSDEEIAALAKLFMEANDACFNFGSRVIPAETAATPPAKDSTGEDKTS